MVATMEGGETVLGKRGENKGSTERHRYKKRRKSDSDSVLEGRHSDSSRRKQEGEM